MGWIAVLAWSIAAVLALGVLGFCAYELTWRLRRLRRELGRLDADRERMAALQRELAAAAGRLRAAGER